MKPTAKQYTEQIATMHANAKRWRAAHPEAQALIQFNYPNKFLPVAPISEAVRLKIVTTNPAGLELLKALWPWDDRYEPTVLMVRVTLELD